MTVHQAAQSGYDRAGASYERGRPSYPPEAISLLAQELNLRQDTPVLELAAGTGKLTRLLLPTGARIIPVEPVAGMRAAFSQALPETTVLDGTAESIPLADLIVEAAVVGQAFHWLDGGRALPEIHRVLQPGGRLGLIWNARDVSVDWVARLTEIIDLHEAGAPRYVSGRWRKAFETSTLFSPLQERQFSCVQRGDAETIIARITSISFIAALSDAERDRVADEVCDLLQTHPQTRGHETYALPYRTDVYWCVKQ